MAFFVLVCQNEIVRQQAVGDCQWYCFRPEAPEAATGSAVVDQATLRIGASCPGRKTLPTVRENGIHPVSGVDEDDTDIRSPSVRP